MFTHNSEPVDPHASLAWLPAVQTAQSVHVGDPATLARTYHTVLDSIERQGRAPTSPVLEEYLALDAQPCTERSIRLTMPLAP